MAKHVSWVQTTNRASDMLGSRVNGESWTLLEAAAGWNQLSGGINAPFSPMTVNYGIDMRFNWAEFGFEVLICLNGIFMVV